MRWGAERGVPHLCHHPASASTPSARDCAQVLPSNGAPPALELRPARLGPHSEHRGPRVRTEKEGDSEGQLRVRPRGDRGWAAACLGPSLCPSPLALGRGSTTSPLGPPAPSEGRRGRAGPDRRGEGPAGPACRGPSRRRRGPCGERAPSPSEEEPEQRAERRQPGRRGCGEPGSLIPVSLLRPQWSPMQFFRIRLKLGACLPHPTQGSSRRSSACGAWSERRLGITNTHAGTQTHTHTRVNTQRPTLIKSLRALGPGCLEGESETGPLRGLDSPAGCGRTRGSPASSRAVRDVLPAEGPMGVSGPRERLSAQAQAPATPAQWEDVLGRPKLLREARDLYLFTGVRDLLGEHLLGEHLFRGAPTSGRPAGGALSGGAPSGGAPAGGASIQGEHPLGGFSTWLEG